MMLHKQIHTISIRRMWNSCKIQSYNVKTNNKPDKTDNDRQTFLHGARQNVTKQHPQPLSIIYSFIILLPRIDFQLSTSSKFDPILNFQHVFLSLMAALSCMQYSLLSQFKFPIQPLTSSQCNPYWAWCPQPRSKINIMYSMRKAN